MSQPFYGRILLKLSGEILAGEKGFGVDPSKAKALAQQVVSAREMGVQVGVVIGGGNIIRGEMAEIQGMDRVSADYLGMLATIMNAITLQDALEKEGCETRTLTAIGIAQLAEPYIRRRAIRHLERDRVIIIAGGTGNPYFSTDTAAALRATEIEADVVLKGTKVDGVYDGDPEKDDQAEKYEQLSFQKVIEDGLRVMDLTAVTLCKENNLPIIVFNVNQTDNLMNILKGKKIGTLVTGS
ncbi:MAG: UMP kinase [Candidatus Marinimicrobia bacterium]|jgi:uridylate kinase|nr:UMP kinase [Candidatus Neomarinimicrobiota bacterium]MDP6456909.1 UMP kinase [Candidatus Neomarinimicrobiota bacterium]MDP6592786.1 UMP kinase [Candidatus Neomarinimicrobiota bacterium]MDP6836307.1 UMP kinase [Candidatus Neomarinimicrobiota bacterium]